MPFPTGWRLPDPGAEINPPEPGFWEDSRSTQPHQTEKEWLAALDEAHLKRIAEREKAARPAAKEGES